MEASVKALIALTNASSAAAMACCSGDSVVVGASVVLDVDVDVDVVVVLVVVVSTVVVVVTPAVVVGAVSTASPGSSDPLPHAAKSMHTPTAASPARLIAA
jgi:hypothetical protein